MVPQNRDETRTAFTISVDLASGTSTGISAADRALTARALADPASTCTDFARPGHIFPIRTRPGGVLEHAEVAEAALDLTRIAGLRPAAVLCQVLNDDGTMAVASDLTQFCSQHGTRRVSIGDVARYRWRTERIFVAVTHSELQTAWGMFAAIVYRSSLDPTEHLALVMGDVSTSDPVLTHIHEECLSSDVFGSPVGDCTATLHAAMEVIASEGRGVVVYIRKACAEVGVSHGTVAQRECSAAASEISAPTAGIGAARTSEVAFQILSDLDISRVTFTDEVSNAPLSFLEAGIASELLGIGHDST